MDFTRLATVRTEWSQKIPGELPFAESGRIVHSGIDIAEKL